MSNATRGHEKCWGCSISDRFATQIATENRERLGCSHDIPSRCHQYHRGIMTAFMPTNQNCRDKTEVCAASRHLLLVKPGHGFLAPKLYPGRRLDEKDVGNCSRGNNSVQAHHSASLQRPEGWNSPSCVGSHKCCPVLSLEASGEHGGAPREHWRAASELSRSTIWTA